MTGAFSEDTIGLTLYIREHSLWYDVFPDASFQWKVVTRVDVFVGLSTFFYTQY